VRDFLAAVNRSVAVSPAAQQQIREAVLLFVRSGVEQCRASGGGALPLEKFIVNNLVSIVTLCLKADFPERWPSAFEDLLALAAPGEGQQLNRSGADFAISVLYELDAEVVEFNKDRSAAEIAHNTAIKDLVRERSTAQDLVVFLCASALSWRQAGQVDLGEKALRTLAQLIGWIDVSLTVERALPTVYQCMGDAHIGGAAAACVFELVKKGMDPMLKVQLVGSIELVQAILAVKVQC